MSGPGDVPLLWEYRALSCTTAASGGGGSLARAGLGQFSLALAMLRSGRVLRFVFPSNNHTRISTLVTRIPNNYIWPEDSTEIRHQSMYWYSKDFSTTFKINILTISFDILMV